jgi:tetratricopeptide (TPR) repeat protein
MPSIDSLQRLLAADPNDAFVLYGLAQEYAKIGETARAVEYYDRCITADTSYCYAYYHKAKALEAAGRVDEAVRALRAGMDAAKKAQDGHALGEMTGYLDEIAP